MRSRKLFCAVATVAVLTFIGSANAQSTSTDDQLGIVPGLSYHGSSIDQVSLSTGNVLINIPLLSYPQRGGALGVDFRIVFNGKGWVVKLVGCPGDGCDKAWSRGGGGTSGLVEVSAPVWLTDNMILTSGKPPTCPYGYTAKYRV